MPSARELFWTYSTYALIGNSAKMPFPRLTYQGLKDAGKLVFPIDPSTQTIEGDPTFPDLISLPKSVEAVILELPNEETASWVKKATDAGVKNVWLHMGTETPEAIEIGRSAGLNLLSGTCAVMYLKPKTFPHNIHKWIMKWSGKF